MLFLFIALMAVLLILGGIILYQLKQASKLQELHYKEKEEIFNRYMAADYQAYRYFKDESPAIVEDMKKTMEKERERTKTKEEVEKEERASRF
jgi:predicted transcriptional regulator